MAIKINNYLKNLGKSIVYASIDNYKQNTAIGAFIGDENNQQLAKDIYHGIKDYKTTLKRAAEAVRTSRVYQTAEFGYKSALEDLKSGNFYNTTREEKLNDAAYGADFDFDEDFNFDEDSDTPSISNDTASTIDTIKRTSEISTDAIAGAVVKSAKYNAEVSKQSTTFIISQQAKFFGDLKNGVLNTNNSLNNLINFNDKVMTTHIENSRKFYEESTKYARENNAILKELLDMERVRFKEEQAIRDRNEKRNNPKQRTRLYDIIDSNGNLNLRSYGEQVKKNFMDNLDEIGLGFFKDKTLDELKAFVANPLGGLVNAAISNFLGNDIKKAHRSLDKTFGGIFSNVIAELNYKGKNSDNPFVSAISKIFGVSVQNKTRVDTSRYEKGAVPFDGKTRKSIIEVIPTYLSQISAALTGGEPLYYDFNAGRWTSYSKVNTEYNKHLEDAKRYATSDLDRSIRNAMASIKSISDDVKKSLLSSLKDYAYTNDTLSGFEQNSFLSEDEKKLYKKISRKIDKRTISKDTISAKNSLAREFENAEISGDDIKNLLFNGYNDSFKLGKNNKVSSIFGRTVDDLGLDSLTYLQSIYNELFWIRKYGTSLGGKVSISGRGKKGTKDTPPGVSVTELARKRKKDEEEEARKNAANEPKSNSEVNLTSDKYKEEYDMEKMSDSEKSVRAIGKEFKNSKIDALTSLATMAMKNPRKLITGTLAIADRSLYDLFFEHKYKDKDGKEISGFFDLLGYKLSTTFDDVKNYLNKKILNPAWRWIKRTAGDFSSALFGKNFFAGVKDEMKSQVASDVESVTGAAKTAANAVKENIQNSPIADKFTEVKNKATDALKDQSEKVGETYNGAKLITSDGLTTISKGEAIIPADMNPFNPDMDKANRQDDRRREDKIRDKFYNTVMKNADGNVSVGTLAGNVTKKYLSNAVANFKKILTSSDKLDADSVNEDFENFAKNSTRTKARGILGGATGGVAGGLFFGPVGLLVGALAGGVANILRDSKTAKDLLLGKEDEETHERSGGIISKKLQKTIKKYAPDLMAIGLPSAAVSGLLMGFGPLGMAAIGSGAVLAKNSKKLQQTIFGKEFTVTDKDGSKRTVEIDGLISRNTQKYIKKHFPGISAAVLGTIAFGPFGGILPNMVLGAGIGMVGVSKTFEELILGYKDPRDPEGKKRRGGLAGVLKEAFVNPLVKIGKFLSTSFFDYLKDTLITPVSKWSGVIGREILHQSKNIGTYIGMGVKFLAEKLIGSSLFTKLTESVFYPIKNAAERFIHSDFGEALLFPVWGAKQLAKIPRFAGKWLSRKADEAKLNQYGRGAVGMTTAAERLSDAAAIGKNYKTIEFDKALAGMSTEETEDLENKLLIMSGKTGSQKAYNQARSNFSNQMARYFRGKESALIKRLRKRFENEDLTPEAIEKEVEIISNDKSLSDKEKEALLKIVKEYGGKIEVARKALNADNSLKSKYAKELTDKFGDAYNFNDKLGIAHALNAVQNDKFVKEDADYRKEAEKAEEAVKKMQEEQLNETSKIRRLLTTIGSMIAKKFGYKKQFAKDLKNINNPKKSKDKNNNQQSDQESGSDNNAPGKQTSTDNTKENNLSDTQVNAEGEELKQASDGSLMTTHTEENADKEREKNKADEKQKGLFASLGDKLKGLYGSAKDKVKGVTKGGFLHNIADSIFGKAGAIAQVAKAGALAAIVGPLVVKALPLVTDFIKQHKKEIFEAGKGILGLIYDFGKSAVGTMVEGIKDSFLNGNFRTGVLQILATAILGNKMLGGAPLWLATKGYGLLKGAKAAAGAAGAGAAVGKAAEAAGAGAAVGKAAGAVATGGGILSKLKGFKLGTGGKLALAGAALYGGYKLFSSATSNSVKTSGLQPGQMYAVDKNGQLQQIDENGKPINDGDKKANPQQPQSTSGGLMDMLSTASDAYFMFDAAKSIKNLFSGGAGAATKATTVAETGAKAAAKGTTAFSKYTEAITKVGSKLKNTSGMIEKVTTGAEKVVGGAGKLTGKAIGFLKDLVVAGIRKAAGLMPGLQKKLGPSMIERLGQTFVGRLVKAGAKYLTKLSTKVTVAMTGVGNIAIIVMDAFFAFDNIYLTGWRKWYNNAKVLYNEDLGDDVKYVSVLSGLISTLLWSVIPSDFIFGILAMALGIDLSAAQQRAQEAVDAYNKDKENHPKGAPDKVRDIEEYNALYEKGILDSVKETGETLLTFGKDTLVKMNQAAKRIGTYVGDKAKAAKDWAKNNAKWLANNGMNWFKTKFNDVKTTVSTVFDAGMQKVKDAVDNFKARLDNAEKAFTKDGGIHPLDAASAFFTDPKPASKDTVPDKAKKDNNDWGIHTNSDRTYDQNDIDYLVNNKEHPYTKEEAEAYLKSQGLKPKPTGKRFGRGFYKQTQYANVGFNIPGDTIHQTIGDSGCGPVAAVNAMQVLGRGTSGDPVIQASNYALQNGFKGKDTGTDPRFFNSYAAKNKIKAKDIAEGNVKSELQQGHPVVLAGEDSKGESNKHPFAEYPHYVTATSYNAKTDTVTIQDPESNYDNQRYKLSNVLNKTTMAKSFARSTPSYNRSLIRRATGRRFGRGNDDVGAYIWNKLTGLGFSSQATAAIMGSMQQESSFDPKASQDGDGLAGSLTKSDGYDGFGLCQWTGSRVRNLAEFCQSNGLDPQSIDGQIAFMVKEMGDRGALDQFNKASTLEDALQVMQDYEGYGVRGNRDEYAAEIFKTQGRGIVTKGSISGGSGGNSKSAPQSSYGIFDSVLKPFDSLNNELNSTLSTITSGGAFKSVKDLASSFFGSMIGGDTSSNGKSSNGAWKGSTATSAGVRRASAWAEQVKDHVQDDVNPPYWYGNTGCTAFANDYLQHAGVKPIDPWVPKAMEQAKEAGMWKEASQPAAEGDVGIIETDGDMSEPDHAVIEDGQGGFWSNLSSGHKIGHGKHSDYFGDIWGYIATGSGNGKVVTDGKRGENDDAEARGKHGLRFGRGKSSLNGLGKSISSHNQKFGRGINNLFNTGALNSSIQSIVSSVTGGNSAIGNAVNAILPHTSTTTVGTSITSQDGVIELLKLVVQLLTTIASNTGNMGNMSKEAIQQQQASITSAISSIGQMISASNQNMLSGVSQMMLVNSGPSAEQQHMAMSLNELASV